MCRLAEQECWFREASGNLGELGVFKTRELALLAQDESSELEVVASTLAGIVGCGTEDISDSARQKVGTIALLSASSPHLSHH